MRPRAAGRRWGAGVLEWPARGVPPGQTWPALVPQDRRRPGCAAQVRPAGAKKALAEIWGAEDATHARAAIKAFAPLTAPSSPRRAAKITGDTAELLAFCDYPAGHWVHLRTTNPSPPS